MGGRLDARGLCLKSPAGETPNPVVTQRGFDAGDVISEAGDFAKDVGSMRGSTEAVEQLRELPRVVVDDL